MSKQVRKIEVRVTTSGEKGLRSVSKQMAKLNKNAKGLNTGLGKLKNTFLAFAGALGVRELARASDSFQLLNDRMKIFSKDSEEAKKTFRSVAAVANTTKTSVEAMAESYTRIALATQELGLTQSQMLATTQALQQTFRISGSTIAEATGATIQLTQGLSSGQLRGQELRSVMEANALLAGILAKKLGIARGQLIKFAESGKITSKVVLEALAENFEKLNKDASKLGTTFEQSVIVVFNKLKMKLHDINQSLGVSSKFESFATAIVDNIEVIMASVTALTTLVVVRAIPSMIGSLQALYAVLMANPWTAVATVILGAVVYLATTWERSFLRMRKAVLYFRKFFIDQRNFIRNGLISIADSFRSLFNLKKPKGDVKKDGLIKGVTGQDYKEIISEIDSINKKLGAGKKNDVFKASFAGMKIDEVKKTASAFYDLNNQMIKGIITIDEYNQKLAEQKQSELNKKLIDGKITLDAYYESIIKTKGAVDDLFGKGDITIGIQQGLKQVDISIGTMAGNIASAVKNAFGTLENMLFKWVKTGKFAFADFTAAILDDLTKIAIKMAIIRPLTNGLLGASGGGGFDFGSIAANGNAYSGGNVMAFAAGGVVSSPTTFGMSGGRTGLMGEAGPEAILPLVRRNGKLGVEGSGSTTIVNVVNNSTAQIETSEKKNENGERVIDVMIVDKMNKAIGEGKLDSAFKNVYGLSRRGR